MPFTLIPRKLVRSFQDRGFLRTVLRGFLFLLRPVFVRRTYRLYKIDLTTLSPPAVKGDDLQFEMLQADDTDIIEQVEQHSEWLSGQIAGKLRNGQICAVALDGRNMAGFNLINFGCVDIPLLETTRQFRPGIAWSEHIAVHADYRGKGVGSRLRYFIFGELKNRGYKRLYGGTLGGNIPSLKLARKVGFTEYVDVVYTKILFHKTWQFKKVQE